VYSREIGGQEYTFGVSGKLIRNVLVMYDRQTESLWSQLLGEAVQGQLKGTKLEFVPAWQTTWQDWKSRHPQTLALQKGFYGNRDSYNPYFSSPDAGVIGETVEDDEAVAYPYSVLNDKPVINDKVGTLPVLVVFDTETGSGVVFERELEGQILTFQSVGELILLDGETGSTWDGQSGVAESGPLAGKSLAQVKSTRSFWFGWKDFYHDTRVYGIEP
jgi:hypothetical protein